MDATRARCARLGSVAAACIAHLVIGGVRWPRPVAAGESIGNQSPLYEWLVRVASPGGLRWVQAALGCALVVCVFDLGQRLEGKVAAHGAMWLAALGVPFWVHEATLDADVFVTVLNTACVVLVLRGAVAQHPGPLIAAGACGGLSLAFRPGALTLLVLAGAWLWPAERVGRAMRVTIFAAAAVLTVAVPGILLRLTQAPPVRAPVGRAIVAHMGNRPESTGVGVQPVALLKLYELQLRKQSAEVTDHMPILYRQFASLAEGRALSAWEADEYWLRKTLAFVRSEPWAFVRMQGRKALLFLLGTGARDAEAPGLPRVPGRVLLVLGLSGFAWAAIRRRSREATLLALAVGAGLLLACAFYVRERYRLAVLPLHAALAGAYVAWMWEVRKDLRALVLGALCLALPAALVTRLMPLQEAMRQEERAAIPQELAAGMQKAIHEGQLPMAARLFVQAQAADPSLGWALPLRGVPFESRALAQASRELAVERFGEVYLTDRFVLATLAQRAGACADAVTPAMQVADTGWRSAVFDGSLDPALVAAQCLTVLGKPGPARTVALEALERRPGTVDGLAMVVALSGEPFAEAPGLGGPFTRQLFELHDPMNARWALARARYEAEDLAGALQEAELILEVLPDAGVVHGLRARALAGSGRARDAVDAFGEAIRLFPDYPHPVRGLEGAFKALVSSPEVDVETLSLAAELELRRGDIPAAKALIERVDAKKAPPSSRAHAERAAFIRAAQPSGFVVEP